MELNMKNLPDRTDPIYKKLELLNYFEIREEVGIELARRDEDAQTLISTIDCIKNAILNHLIRTYKEKIDLEPNQYESYSKIIKNFESHIKNIIPKYTSIEQVVKEFSADENIMYHKLNVLYSEKVILLKNKFNISYFQELNEVQASSTGNDEKIIPSNKTTLTKEETVKSIRKQFEKTINSIYNDEPFNFNNKKAVADFFFIYDYYSARKESKQRIQDNLIYQEIDSIMGNYYNQPLVDKEEDQPMYKSITFYRNKKDTIKEILSKKQYTKFSNKLKNISISIS